MRTVVSLSGGLDSTVLATCAAHERADVIGCSFDYGQTHRRELHAAAAVAGHLGIEHMVIDLKGLLAGSALLGEGSVPDGHYAEESMSATVVHGRNLLFLSALVPVAGSGGEVWLGPHAGDHYVYPDCRPEFWASMSATVAAAYNTEVKTPFIAQSKSGIAWLGDSVGAPMGLSWSCYKGGQVHCGRCGTCVERAEAFHLAGVNDPTDYADADYWRGVTA